MRIYISGPLQAAPDLGAARAFYESIAHIAADLGHDAYLPHLNTDPVHAAALPPREVFQRDQSALAASDVVIAHVGQASTGVGAELAIAVSRRIAVLGIARPEEQVSRFAEGLIESADGTVQRFDTVNDLRAVMRSFLEAATKSAVLPSPR